MRTDATGVLGEISQRLADASSAARERGERVLPPLLILGTSERVGSNWASDTLRPAAAQHNEPFRQQLAAEHPWSALNPRFTADERCLPASDALGRHWLVSFAVSKYGPARQVVKETNLFFALPALLALLPGALRLARQHLLARPEPPEYWVVMDETVLRRPIGGPQVMREQLAYLIEATQLPTVTIQVIPFTAGWHPALHGMFNIYRFAASEVPDVVYGESLTGAFYLNKPDEAARYIEALDQMCAQAASPEQTAAILRDTMKEI